MPSNLDRKGKMRLLIPMGLDIAGILVTVVMWISGNGFYLCYVPAGTGDGIAQYSPIWILLTELAAAYGIFKRKLWGPLILFAPAVATSIDIYPAWMILGRPDRSLVFHIAVTVLMWLTALTGAMAYRYLTDE